MSKVSGKHTMWTIDLVRKFVEDQGCKLLTTTYVNYDTHMEYICTCGNQFTATFRVFKGGTRCKECFKRKRSAAYRMPQEKIRAFLEEQGCTLTSDYRGVDAPLSYICSCGTPHTSTFRCFRDGARCPKCKREKLLATRYRFSYEYVKKYFEDHGCKLLSTHYYSGKAQKLDYMCKCGRKAQIKFHSFKAGARCFQCMVDGLSGENSRWYNPNLTNAERELRDKRKRKMTGYRPWKRQVHERDGFKCVKCGATEHLEAHHLYSFAEHIGLRFAVENGVTLCKDCHVAFHTRYTTMNNTKEQFDKFMRE